MALPGGFSLTHMIQVYGGEPLDYQIDGYLAQVSASTNQRTVVATIAHKHQAVINPDDLQRALTNNS